MDLSSFTDLAPSMWFFVKVLVVLTMGIYGIFAFVIVKQVNLMTKTLQLEVELGLNLYWH